MKDGSSEEYNRCISIKEAAEGISAGLAKAALAGEVHGVVKDLSCKLEKDCMLNLLTFDSEGVKLAYRHLTSHIMAPAVKRFYPEVKLTIGPAIEYGFCYDLDSDKNLGHIRNVFGKEALQTP